MLACYIAKVNDAHLKVAATESTAEAIEATGRRRYERQRRTGRIARRGGQALLRRAGRTTAKDQGNGRVKGAHLKVAATESTAEAIEATGRRRYERQRRTGRIALLRRAGLCHQVNGDCGGDVDVRARWGAALRSREAGPVLRMNCSRAAGAIHKQRTCQN